MAVLATMGIKALYYAPVNTSNPEVMPTSGWKAVDVYQDTCSFVDNDPTSTTHKSETSKKRITIVNNEGAVLAFSIMDPSLDEKVSFQGGSITTDEDTDVRSYKKPVSGQTSIQLAFKILPLDGLALNISCADVVGKRNTTYSSKGISLLDVTVDPLYDVEDSEDVSTPTLAS